MLVTWPIVQAMLLPPPCWVVASSRFSPSTDPSRFFQDSYMNKTSLSGIDTITPGSVQETGHSILSSGVDPDKEVSWLSFSSVTRNCQGPPKNLSPIRRFEVSIQVLAATM